MDPQEDDFIDACRVVDDDANVDDNFVVVSFKGYSERLDKEHYAFIPVEGVVVARAPFFRTEHISAARKLLGEPEHYYDTGNFEFQSRITDTLDPSKTYAFASELRAAGVYALSSCECTPKSTSQNVNEGTMSHLREARVMRLGHISHNYNGAFTAFRSFVDKVAATFWERMSLRGGVEYTEYPSASALEHALASGEVDFATTFGTAVAMFGTPPNWEFTYSCHTNVDVVRLVTKGITSLEALRSKVAGGARLRVADTSRDGIELLASQNIMRRLGFPDVEWVRYEYDRDSRDAVLQRLVAGDIDADIALAEYQTSINDGSSTLAYISTGLTSPASFVFRQDSRQACGDGVVDFELGEECDGSESCDPTCSCTSGTTGTRLVSPVDAGDTVTVQTCRPACGNGVLDAGEECDGGTGCDGECRCRTGYEPRHGSVSCAGEDGKTRGVLALVTLVAALLAVLAVATRLLMTRRKGRAAAHAREASLRDAGVPMETCVADGEGRAAPANGAAADAHKHRHGHGAECRKPAGEAKRAVAAILASPQSSDGCGSSLDGASLRTRLTDAQRRSSEGGEAGDGTAQGAGAEGSVAAASATTSTLASTEGSLLTGSSALLTPCSQEPAALPPDVAKGLRTVPVLQYLAAALERQAQVAAAAPRATELRAKCARLPGRTAAELGVSYRTEVCFNNTQTPLGIGSVNTTQVRVANVGSLVLALSFVPPEPKPEYLLGTTPAGLVLQPGESGVFTVSLVFTVSKRISERLHLVCRVQGTGAGHEGGGEAQRCLVTTPLTLDVSSCPSQLVDPESVGLSAMHTVHETPHATTYLTEWKGAYVLLKRYAPVRAWQEYVRAEVGLLSTLSHPNILSFMGVISTPFVASLLEVTDLGLLQTRIAHREPMPLEYRARVLCDVACGLSYLHQTNVAHLGIATDSVYLTSGGIGTTVVAKLADFTLARFIGAADGDEDRDGNGNSDGVADGDGRTIPPARYAYTAPERFAGARGGLAADVYGFAMLAWAVLALEEPFAGFGAPDDIRAAVCAGVRPPPLTARPPTGEDAERRGTAEAQVPAPVCESIQLWWDGSPRRRTDAKSVAVLMRSFERSVREQKAEEARRRQEQPCGERQPKQPRGEAREQRQAADGQ